MKKVVKQNKIVVIIVSIMLVLTVGYALFSETLNINGTAKASGDFNIVFDRLEGNLIEKGSKGATANIENNGKTLSINIPNFEYPSAYVGIPVIIKNKGSIDAKLKGIKTEGIDGEDIKIAYIGIAEDGIIKSNEEKLMQIMITWLESSTTTVDNLKFKIELEYEQVTNEESVPPEEQEKIEFPKVVSGQLGDNVYYTFENGIVNITGSGPMWTKKSNKDIHCKTNTADMYCSLVYIISNDISESLSKGNVAIEGSNLHILPYFIGNTYSSFDEYLNLSGDTEENFKNFLLERGVSNIEEANYVIKILRSIPETSKIKSINIEEGITSFKDKFFYLINVNSITIPNSVAKLGYNSFRNINVKTLTFGSGVNIIEPWTIYDTDIENIIFNEGLEEIRTDSIRNVRNLETIVNKTGKAFDWNGILGNGSGTPFETGTVTVNGKTITITK